MHQLDDRTYTIGPVPITGHPIDWKQLGPELDDFADLTYDRFTKIRDFSGEHRYLNPMFSLFAPGEVTEHTFLIQAERACMLWMRQLKRVAGRCRVRRFQRLESSPGNRMLITSGVLILSGRI